MWPHPVGHCRFSLNQSFKCIRCPPWAQPWHQTNTPLTIWWLKGKHFNKWGRIIKQKISTHSFYNSFSQMVWSQSTSVPGNVSSVLWLFYRNVKLNYVKIISFTTNKVNLHNPFSLRVFNLQLNPKSGPPCYSEY